MLKYFSQNQSLVLILIPLITALFLGLEYYFPLIDLADLSNANLWKIDFSHIHPLLSKILAGSVITANAININFVFNNLEFYERFNYLPSIFYVLLISLLPTSYYVGEDIIAHFFFIFSFYQALKIQSAEDVRNNVFLSGFFLGLATTFNPVYLVFMLTVWISVFIVRPLILKEYLLPLIGFSLPYLWVALVNPNWLTATISFDMNTDFINYNLLVLWFSGIAIVLLFFLSAKNMIERRMKSSIIFKRISFATILSLVIFFLTGFVITLIFESYSLFIAGIVLLPFIIPYSYLNVKNTWFASLLFYILLFTSFAKFFI